jgi:NAD(P)-dependent dehydrogenase (short-subunit alcohol dehydrogenase family)
MESLTGLVAIVTGGGTGIGRGVALRLAEEGCRVAVFGRRREPLEATSKSMGRTGEPGLVLQGDVSNADDVRMVVEATVSQLGGLDIVVNNAGIGGGGVIHKHDLQRWDDVMAVNLRGPFLMARFALPIMRSQKRGHIINISSESALRHYAGNGAYGVSKHALNALSEYIQVENQDLNIRVDTICPGMVLTPMSEGSPGLDPAKCLMPEDIADLIVWLVSRRTNVKIGTPVLIQTMENPWT